MNKTKKSSLLVLILCTFMMLISSTIVLANSAQPPSLIILVNNPPKDLSIVLVSNGMQQQARVQRVAWEGYYAFYSMHIQTNVEYTFRVNTNEGSFECTISPTLKNYDKVFTLDIPNQKLIPGTYPFRRVMIVSIRLLLTLLLEGMIFWLFGFRQKRSWIVFLCINLITQGALNIWLNSGGSLMPSYLIISLITGEFFVFMFEMLTFPLFIEEHGKGRSMIYAFIANFVSLIAGGYIISVLPV